MLKKLKKKLYFKKLVFYLEQCSYIIVWWADKKIPLMLDTIESIIKQDSLSISNVLWQKNSIIFSLFFKNQNLMQKGSYLLTTLRANNLPIIGLIVNKKINELFSKEKASFVGFMYKPEMLFLNPTRWQILFNFYVAFQGFLTSKFFKLKLLLLFFQKFITKLKISTFLIFRNNVLFLKCF